MPVWQDIRYIKIYKWKTKSQYNADSNYMRCTVPLLFYPIYFCYAFLYSSGVDFITAMGSFLVPSPITAILICIYWVSQSSSSETQRLIDVQPFDSERHLAFLVSCSARSPAEAGELDPEKTVRYGRKSGFMS